MLFGHSKKWMILKLLATCLFLVILPGYVESGLHKMMLKAMMHHLAEGGGYESKGITFGLRSKGMTAVIPVPIPIPLFSKGGGGGGKGGGKVKYIPVPVPSGGGGGGGWWR